MSVLRSDMATKVTAEIEVWSTDSATLWAKRSGWSWFRSCMSSSFAIAGYLLRCYREIFQSNTVAHVELHNSLSAAIDPWGHVQEYCISWASTWCDQSSTASAVQLVCVQKGLVVHHRADDEEADLRAYVWQHSCCCSNRCSAESILVRWRISVWVFLSPSGLLKCCVGNRYDG